MKTKVELTLGEKTINSIEPIKKTGLSISDVSDNEINVVMPLAGNANHNGIMYAGSLFALAECAAGVLFMNKFSDNNIAPICANVNIRFRRPAMSDITLHINITDEQFTQLAEDVDKNGKASIEFEEKLVDVNGEVVSIAQVQYVLLKV